MMGQQVSASGRVWPQNGGGGIKMLTRGDQVRQEIFYEILKRPCRCEETCGKSPSLCPLRACGGNRPAKRRKTYPYHEDRFPDVTHTVVDQTGRINELVLLEGLRGVCAQCLDRYFHLFGKAGHHCKLRQRENRLLEIWRSWMLWSGALFTP